MMLHPELARERLAVIAWLAAAVTSLQGLRLRLGSDPDPEVLHHFRVNMRRIRTALRVIGAAVRGADGARLQEDCRWLAGRGSAWRDLDVLLASLPEYLGTVPAAEEGAVRWMRSQLGRRRTRARRALLAALDSRRAHTLFEQLQGLATISEASPDWPQGADAARQLRRVERRVRRDGEALESDGASVDELHTLRKRCKHLRYLLEMYDGALAGRRDTDALVKRLRKLQNALGDFQDLSTHAAIIGDLAGMADVATAVPVRRLAQELAARAEAQRRRVGDRFERFAGGREAARIERAFRRHKHLSPPWVGTRGYCHGDADARVIGLPLGKIVCVGRNYAAHAAELGNAVPETPLLFIKPASAAVSFAPQIRIPRDRGSVHHELEIALLIGRELCDANPARARRAIAGIGLALDLTLRDVQNELKASAQPWEIAKGFDGACPLSLFHPVPEDLDLGALELRLSVNDRERQAGSSAQMITPIIELLCFMSRQFTLWPGDVVLTGTPQGVGPLVAGDALVAEIPGVLSLHTEIV